MRLLISDKEYNKFAKEESGHAAGVAGITKRPSATYTLESHRQH
jgi:hypothetical protein